jgi:cytochrome c oxidase subunit 2
MSRWLPIPASTFAPDVDHLILFITVIVGVWFLAAEAVLFFLVWRYRRRKDRRASYVTGSSRAQMAWVLIPCTAILACDLFIDGASGRVWDHMKQFSPSPQLTIWVEGRQWAWDITSPGPDGVLDTADDIATGSEVHVPVNAVVRFELRSKDTLHSFWVPELRTKQDVVPGRVITGWFEATRPGTYPILCAQLCGLGHAIMRGQLVVDAGVVRRETEIVAAFQSVGATSPNHSSSRHAPWREEPSFLYGLSIPSRHLERICNLQSRHQRD